MSPKGGKRKGAGRKPLPEDQRRTRRIMISLTEAEASELAEVLGDQAPATYVAELLRKHLQRKRRSR